MPCRYDVACRVAEIVREVVEARSELYAAAGARETERADNAPPDSITPPSLPEGEGEQEEREYNHFLYYIYMYLPVGR